MCQLLLRRLAAHHSPGELAVGGIVVGFGHIFNVLPGAHGRISLNLCAIAISVDPAAIRFLSFGQLPP
jgi:hypothetical protein